MRWKEAAREVKHLSQNDYRLTILMNEMSTAMSHNIRRHCIFVLAFCRWCCDFRAPYRRRDCTNIYARTYAHHALNARLINPSRNASTSNVNTFMIYIQQNTKAIKFFLCFVLTFFTWYRI